MSDFVERIAALRRADAAFSLLENDIAAEKASALGHHGRLVEKAMGALRDYDAQGGARGEARLTLVKAAAREVWAYFVQREACGMRDHRPVIQDYRIPGEVLVRLGAIDP